MGLIGFAGFEDNNYSEVTPIGVTVLSPTAPRTGNYCLRIETGSNNLFNKGWVMPVGVGEFYFQYAAKYVGNQAVTDDKACFQWLDQFSNVMGAFYIRTTSLIYNVYVGNKVTLIGSTVTGLSSNWTVIEGYIKIHASEGRVIIRVNGVTEVDFTGNTQPGEEDAVAVLRHGNFPFGTNGQYLYFDDIIVQDTTGAAFNSWPMGIKCHKVAAPLANGNYAQWTPSAGDNFQCIDETPPSMDDYVEGAAGQKDSYPFGDAPAGLSGIAGVVTRFYGQGNGNIKRLCRYGGTDYLSSAFAVPGTFNKVDDVMAEKPGGGGWDETTFNACEFGMEHQ